MYKEGRIWVPPRSRRFTLVIALFGILCTALGSFQLYYWYSFYSRSLKAEGIVVYKGEDIEGYYLNVSFVNEKTGKEVTVSYGYDIRFGEVGDKVEVLYNPDNPTFNIFIGLHWIDSLPGLVLFIGVFLLLGIVLLISAFYSARGYYQSQKGFFPIPIRRS